MPTMCIKAGNSFWEKEKVRGGNRNGVQEGERPGETGRRGDTESN